MERERRSILIVDSSASSIFLIATLLRQLNYAVRSVGSAEDALAAITRSSFQTVITDTALPKMSGVDLLKTIKNNESLRFIPVMIYTGDQNLATREACARIGCFAYLSKPIEPETLFRTIQSATEATPRKFIRVNTTLKVRIASGDPGSKTRTEGTKNISEGGLFVGTPVHDPINTPVSLTLFLPNREITATAVVTSIWAESGAGRVPGMGLKFTEIKDADVGSLREYIRTEVMKDLAGSVQQ